MELENWVCNGSNLKASASFVFGQVSFFSHQLSSEQDLSLVWSGLVRSVDSGPASVLGTTRVYQACRVVLGPTIQYNPPSTFTPGSSTIHHFHLTFVMRQISRGGCGHSCSDIWRSYSILTILLSSMGLREI